jgi:hypothetical protein
MLKNYLAFKMSVTKYNNVSQFKTHVSYTVVLELKKLRDILIASKIIRINERL